MTGSTAARPGEDALRRALKKDPARADLWLQLGDRLSARGDHAGAATAHRRHLAESRKAPVIAEAARLAGQGARDTAEHRLAHCLAADPDNLAATLLLGELLTRRGAHAAVEDLLAAWLTRTPRLVEVRRPYAIALYSQRKIPRAIAEIEQLLVLAPEDPLNRYLMAAAVGHVGDWRRAISLYRDLVAEQPDDPRRHLGLAKALQAVGRSEEAAAAYREGLSIDPGRADAWWGLANLKTGRFSDDDETVMRHRLQHQDLPAEDLVHLHYALGQAREDADDPAGAFSHYAAGARLRRERTSYSADAITGFTERCRSLFTPAFFAARRNGGHSSGEPIFIVGLPRSGSTLVEQILASHSMVEGTAELYELGDVARTMGGEFPKSLVPLDCEARTAMGAAYLEATRVYRKLGRPRFTDKMPRNFHYLGLIAVILPGARIIDVRRHPMANGFSVYKQLFSPGGQPFSYDLAEIGRYYRDYVSLMDHFDRVLPGLVHRVVYEDLVADVEGRTRALLTHCGLPFEPACLRFFETDRAVSSFSAGQVRRPVSRAGLDHWRAYEPWLAPLRDALGPVLETWRGAK